MRKACVREQLEFFPVNSYSSVISRSRGFFWLGLHVSTPAQNLGLSIPTRDGPATAEDETAIGTSASWALLSCPVEIRYRAESVQGRRPSELKSSYGDDQHRASALDFHGFILWLLATLACTSRQNNKQ